MIEITASQHLASSYRGSGPSIYVLPFHSWIIFSCQKNYDYLNDITMQKRANWIRSC